jgi:hypothetical protein
MGTAELVDSMDIVAADKGPAAERAWLLVLQLCVLVAAAAVSWSLAELWLYVAIRLFDMVFQRPAVLAGIVLLICVALFLCIRAAMRSPVAPIRFACRVILLAVGLGAGVVSIEFLYGGMVSSGIAGLEGSLEDHLPLIAGFVFLALAAAGIKYGFGWRVHYLIVLVLVAITDLAWMAYVTGALFLGGD